MTTKTTTKATKPAKALKGANKGQGKGYQVGQRGQGDTKDMVKANEAARIAAQSRRKAKGSKPSAPATETSVPMAVTSSAPKPTAIPATIMCTACPVAHEITVTERSTVAKTADGKEVYTLPQAWLLKSDLGLTPEEMLERGICGVAALVAKIDGVESGNFYSAIREGNTKRYQAWQKELVDAQKEREAAKWLKDEEAKEKAEQIRANFANRALKPSASVATTASKSPNQGGFDVLKVMIDEPAKVAAQAILTGGEVTTTEATEVAQAEVVPA